jgi:hypothetical protein
MSTFVETTTLVANHCGCKRQTAAGYEVFGETELCTDDGKGKLIVPVSPVLRQEPPTNLPTVIIVRCLACGRKTFHQVNGRGKWMIVAPKGWRKHVRFDWSRVQGPKTLRNISIISYDWRSETKNFGFVYAPDGELADDQSYHLNKLMRTYLDTGLGSKRRFRACWKDAVYNRLLYYKVEVERDKERVRGLQLALEQAIVQLWQLRHMSKSPKLEEVRKGLEAAIDASDVPPDIRDRLVALLNPASSEAPFEAAAGS